MILFWGTCYPLNNLDFFPNSGWNLFTYLLFLAVPMLMFMICEVITPHNTTDYVKAIDLKEYYYKYHRIILGLAWTLQVCLLGNFFVFYAEEYLSVKVLGRVIMLIIMLPLIISANRRLHEIGMAIFFMGFIYTIIKYPYTKEGEKKAKAAARQYGGKYIDDKKGGGGASIMIAVGTAKKPTNKKAKKKKA